MWISILASILCIGASLNGIHFFYLRIRHPDLAFSEKRRFPGFLQVENQTFTQWSDNVDDDNLIAYLVSKLLYYHKITIGFFCISCSE